MFEWDIFMGYTRGGRSDSSVFGQISPTWGQSGTRYRTRLSWEMDGQYLSIAQRLSSGSWVLVWCNGHLSLEGPVLLGCRPGTDDVKWFDLGADSTTSGWCAGWWPGDEECRDPLQDPLQDPLPPSLQGTPGSSRNAGGLLGGVF